MQLEHAAIKLSAFERPSKGRSGPGGKAFIRVQDQNPLAPGMGERLIARGGKVIPPRKLEDASPSFLCDFPRSVLASRVDDDDFVDDASGGGEAIGKHRLFVARDHAKREFEHQSLLDAAVVLPPVNRILPAKAVPRPIAARPRVGRQEFDRERQSAGATGHDDRRLNAGCRAAWLMLRSQTMKLKVIATAAKPLIVCLPLRASIPWAPAWSRHASLKLVARTGRGPTGRLQRERTQAEVALSAV
jgi:hypothetical protein